MAGKPTQQRERDQVTEQRDGPAVSVGRKVQQTFAEQIQEILAGDMSAPVSDSEVNRLLEAIRRMPSNVDNLTLDFADEMAQALLHADLLGRSQVADTLEEDAQDPEAQFSAPGALAGNFTPDEAFAWISNKISITRQEFDALSQELQAHAFTVARTANLQQIERMRQFLSNQLLAPSAVPAGRGVVRGVSPAPISKREFISKFRDNFSDAHLETVYRTNVHSSFEAGKREMIMNPRNRSFVAMLQIVTARDFRVREDHVPLHGFTAPPDDPIWQRLYPPFSFNCRCSVVALSSRKLESRGITASPSTHAAYSFQPDFAPPGSVVRRAVRSDLARSAEQKERRITQ